jgi:hypothetical protein
VVQVIEYLSSAYRALNSKPSSHPSKKESGKGDGRNFAGIIKAPSQLSLNESLSESEGDSRWACGLVDRFFSGRRG